MKKFYRRMFFTGVNQDYYSLYVRLHDLIGCKEELEQLEHSLWRPEIPKKFKGAKEFENYINKLIESCEQNYKDAIDDILIALNEEPIYENKKHKIDCGFLHKHDEPYDKIIDYEEACNKYSLLRCIFNYNTKELKDKNILQKCIDEI